MTDLDQVSPEIQKSIIEYLVIAGRVLKDKCWYSLWNFDLLEKVNRIYPKESYYDNLSTLLTSSPNYITDNIYLGNAFNAADHRWLKDHDIKIIINVTPSISNYYPDEFKYYSYNTTDLNGSTLSGFYDRFYHLVKENADKKIFVHCFAGKSRSAVLVLFYLMQEYGWSLEKSLEFLKEKRPCININTTFIDELKAKYEEIQQHLEILNLDN